MTREMPEKKFEQSLFELTGTYQLRDVFNDFLDYALLFSRWWDRKPEDFLHLEQRYTEKRQYQLFASAYIAMGEIATGDGTGFKDPFGDFYMEHLSNSHNGQFFTPEDICEMIVKMEIGDKLPDNATVMDPACGSGRLLLHAAKLNRRAKFYAADLDVTCCKMTVLNFLMNSMCGEVAWMNSLSLEHYKSWHISKIMDETGCYLPYYIESGPQQTSMTDRIDKASTKTFEKDNNKNSSTSKKKQQCKQTKQNTQLNLEFE